MSAAKLLHPHGALTANDVIIDYLDDNLRRLKRTLSDMSADCLYWQADTQANSIAVILWHMGRLLDVFFAQFVLDLPAEKERWFAGGWAGQTGYDPRGLGRDGWGSVNQYTLEEVAAMPEFDLELLLDFIDDVYDIVRDYLLSTPIEKLAEAAPGFDGQFTRYQVISMALMDNIRHLGEIRLIQSMWRRVK